ncbi:hypothetical protein GC175_29200 [bacterium]|nr:hypothetical protein [bacterium]
MSSVLNNPIANQVRFARALLAWRTVLLLFFAALFAFVFPFICWGALADPGHLHTHAHFVFVEPPQRPVHQEDAWHSHPPGHHHDGHAATEHGDVAGQAQLDTLLLMLLLVLFWVWRYRHFLPVVSVGMQTVLGASIHAPLLATPPPRTC